MKQMFDIAHYYRQIAMSGLYTIEFHTIKLYHQKHIDCNA